MKLFKQLCLTTCVLACTGFIGIAAAADVAIPETITPDGAGNYTDNLGNLYMSGGDGTFTGPDGVIFNSGEGVLKTPAGIVTEDGAGGYNGPNGVHYSPDGKGGFVLDAKRKQHLAYYPPNKQRRCSVQQLAPR